MEQQMIDPSQRYQVVHAGFWWRIKIGDGGVPYGRYYSKDEAQRMCDLLLREFRNGEYVADQDIGFLRAVAAAARTLIDNAEEYDCDGLGLFAQHGWWEPLHDALEALGE